MLFCLPTTHVDAHLGNYGLRVLYFDAVDSRKVHARDAVQLPAEIKARLTSGANPCRDAVPEWVRSLGRSLDSMLLSCPSMRSSHV